MTLAEPKDEQDTTEVLRGRVSLVRIYTGTWAERQANTWTEEARLRKLLKDGEGVVQMIDVNVEENAMKARIVKMFMWWQRRGVEQPRHGMYFLVTRGITEEIRHALGIFNGQVGYVFLVDGHCRVRWAGSAEADAEEKASLVRGLVKLVQEMKKMQDTDRGSADPAARQRLSSFTARIPAILG